MPYRRGTFGALIMVGLLPALSGVATVGSEGGQTPTGVSKNDKKGEERN